MRQRPSVLHVDMDAFFAAVEQRDKPSLRGRPVVVGGTGWRGVVATASYEARAYGVGSAMATVQARRRCPHAAYLAGRFAAYQAVSAQVLELAADLSPLLEPVSLDEAYLDLAPAHPDLDAGTVRELAEGFRRAVRRETGLSVSVGAGTSKLVAKIASDLHKPDALVVVRPGEEAAVLGPLPARALPGVGPVTAERLVRHGLRTVADLAAAGVDELVAVAGRAHGTTLHAYARGEDTRPVVAERDAKSVSAEETFGHDLVDRRELAHHADRLAGRVAERLARHGSWARTVTIKVRRYDFSTLTRAQTLPHPGDDAGEIAAAARRLLDAVDVGGGVRLLGVGVTGFTGYSQQDLLADLPGEGTPPAASDDAVPAEVAGTSGDAPGDDGTAPGDDGPLPAWRPGQDVRHDVHGPGWVQGSGLGRVTVRFEGPTTPPGPVRTLAVHDPALRAADPPVYRPPRPAAGRDEGCDGRADRDAGATRP